MGANEFTLEELEALFNEETSDPQPTADDGQQTPPETPPAEPKPSGKEATKAVSERINAVRQEERNNIAKQMGYDSYDAMVKANEAKLITDKGYDPTELEPLVEEMLKSRMENDPRLKELEQFRKKQVEEYAVKQISEISKLTDGEITAISQLPKEVIELWAKTGDLKASFLQLRGEHYINKAKSSATKGGTEHMQNPAGPPPGQTKTRPLTDDEKSVWKKFFPQMTDEELSNKTMPI